MQVVKYILMVLYIIDCLGLIIVTMMQNSDSRGASGTIVLLQTISMRRIKEEHVKEN